MRVSESAPGHSPVGVSVSWTNTVGLGKDHPTWRA
jgi:hypothetical protein